MRGIILCGGSGSRLYPLTKVTNKHCLPIGDRPMIFHSIQKMVDVGITDICIVTGYEHVGSFASLLGDGSELKCDLTYRVQMKSGGIAQALALAEGFIHPGDSMCVLLGDNIFEDKLSKMVEAYAVHYPTGAMVVLKKVSDPERFGVATIQGGTISKIVEKPEKPESQFAVTGIYFYDWRVFDSIRMCKPSKRGELEITDVNNHYVRLGQMRFVHMDGWWTDAGTHESYRLANELVLGMGTK